MSRDIRDTNFSVTQRTFYPQYLQIGRLVSAHIRMPSAELYSSEHMSGESPLIRTNSNLMDPLVSQL